jgi:hypothetical protein
VGVVASGNVAAASAADGHASQAGPAGGGKPTARCTFGPQKWLLLD